MCVCFCFISVCYVIKQLSSDQLVLGYFHMLLDCFFYSVSMCMLHRQFHTLASPLFTLLTKQDT